MSSEEIDEILSSDTIVVKQILISKKVDNELGTSKELEVSVDIINCDVNFIIYNQGLRMSTYDNLKDAIDDYKTIQ